MKVQRLFHVLVVMSAAGCDSGDDDGDSRRTGDPEPDAAVSTGSGSGSAEEGELCFCDQQPCCDRSVEPAELADGFVCCWSTTCP